MTVALVAALEAQPHRRFIKTDTPLDGLPLDDRVTYIVSAATHATSASPGSATHIRTFWPATTGVPTLVLIHYGDLQTDLEGQMRHLARRLGLDVPSNGGRSWCRPLGSARCDV